MELKIRVRLSVVSVSIGKSLKTLHVALSKVFSHLRFLTLASVLATVSLLGCANPSSIYS